MKITANNQEDLFFDSDKDLLQRFKEFHQKNPEVYRLFKLNAEKILLTGRKKYSAWTIIQVIRWEYDLKTQGDVFQINNDYIAIYARLLIYNDSKFKGFFELRSMKPNKRKISKEQSNREAVQ